MPIARLSRRTSAQALQPPQSRFIASNAPRALLLSFHSPISPVLLKTKRGTLLRNTVVRKRGVHVPLGLFHPNAQGTDACSRVHVRACVGASHRLSIRAPPCVSLPRDPVRCHSARLRSAAPACARVFCSAPDSLRSSRVAAWPLCLRPLAQLFNPHLGVPLRRGLRRRTSRPWQSWRW